MSTPEGRASAVGSTPQPAGTEAMRHDFAALF